MRKWILTLLISTTLAACDTKTYSTAFNLDFEYKADAARPTKWSLPDALYHGYATSLDLEQRQHGASSLQMVQTDLTKSGWAIFSLDLPTERVAGQDVELSGWIKTAQVCDGFADLYLIQDEKLDYDKLALDTLRRGVRNTTEWTRISVKSHIENHTAGVCIGGILKGGGTAWFDNLELTIDGVKLQDTLLTASKTRLTRQDKAELRKYMYPLRTFEPDGGDTEDLSVLHRLIGDSKVVALDENTHGSSEIFKMKNRLIQYLAAHEGFDIFSIEAGMPESYKLNEYTIHGKGDPKELIAGMYFWTWNTREMLDLVEWMRRFNQPEPRITYTGFDMQDYAGSMKLLRGTFTNNRQATLLLEKIDSNLAKVLTYSSINAPRIDPTIANTTTNDLQQLKSYIDKSGFSEQGKAWLHQNGTLLHQYLGQGTLKWRDDCMASNLLWINDHNPLSRIVIWAHNGHIQKTGNAMGHFLKESLGTDYVSVGFTFYDGTYSAIRRDNDPFIHRAQCAYPGTLEYLLEQLDEPVFILNLKKIQSDDSPIMAWIDALNFRHVGAVKIEQEFSDRKITDAFDYLLFIRASTPSHLL